MASSAIVDQLSVALFYPRTASEEHLHTDLIIWLAVINILTIATTFLLAPAL